MALTPDSLVSEESPGGGVPHRPSQGAALGFHPALSWSHYRALMRVEKLSAREFYEQEAVACGWSKVQLERQIETLRSTSSSFVLCPVRHGHSSGEPYEDRSPATDRNFLIFELWQSYTVSQF